MQTPTNENLFIDEQWPESPGYLFDMIRRSFTTFVWNIGYYNEFIQGSLWTSQDFMKSQNSTRVNMTDKFHQ